MCKSRPWPSYSCRFYWPFLLKLEHLSPSSICLKVHCGLHQQYFSDNYFLTTTRWNKEPFVLDRRWYFVLLFQVTNAPYPMPLHLKIFFVFAEIQTVTAHTAGGQRGTATKAISEAIAHFCRKLGRSCQCGICWLCKEPFFKKKKTAHVKVQRKYFWLCLSFFKKLPLEKWIPERKVRPFSFSLFFGLQRTHLAVI